MKIDSLYISAFGGIKNLKLDFSDGFNVIYGDNENGKSTVMAFIKMMFFGSERGSAQISKSIRKKSTPWDGSQMAGSIDFTHSGKRYRIEREFKTSNSTDKVTLIDLDLGTRRVVPGDIGVKFFGLSPAAFERSVFIGQFGFPESDNDAEGELNSRLSNIALTGEESISFETVYKRLEAAKLSLMSKSGRAGEYDKNIKLYSEIKARIEKASSAHSEFTAKKAQIDSLKQEIALLEKNAEALKNQIGAEQDIRNAERFKKYLAVKAELDELNEGLRLDDGTILDELFLRKLQFCISKVETAKNKAEAKQSEAESFEKSISAGLNPPADATEDNAKRLEGEIAALIKEKEELKLKRKSLEEAANATNNTPQKSKGNIIFLILGVVILLAGAVLTALKVILPGVISLILALALIVLFIVLKGNAQKELKAQEEARLGIKNKLEKLENYVKTLEDGIFSKQVRLEAIKTALNSTAEVIKRQTEMLNAAKAEWEKLEGDRKSEEKVLLELFSRYASVSSVEEILSKCEELSSKVAKQKELKQQVAFLATDLGGITKEEAEARLEEIEKGAVDLSADFDILKARYDEYQKEIKEKASLVAALSAESRAALSAAENPEELKIRLKALEEKIVAQKEFCEVADIAMSALADSFAEARRSYGSVLEKKSGEIFSKLTGGKYETMSVSKSFDINVSEAGVFGSREIGYLSSGTADQAYLSLRLALSELISENEKLPILLDDALTQYDDGRMKQALEFLKNYSENTQVIMFTCHKAISEEANGNKINLAK